MTPPQLLLQVNANRTTPPSLLNASLENTVYVVFKLETTEFSHNNNNIIEIACHTMVPLEDCSYSSLMCPPRAIPSFVSELTRDG